MAGMDQMLGAATWHATHTPAANTAAIATRAAEADRTHFITSLEYSLSAAAAAVTTVTVKSGTTVLKTFQVKASAEGPVVISWKHPLRCARGEKAEAELGAGGAAVIGSVNISGFTGGN